MVVCGKGGFRSILSNITSIRDGFDDINMKYPKEKIETVLKVITRSGLLKLTASKVLLILASRVEHCFNNYNALVWFSCKG